MLTRSPVLHFLENCIDGWSRWHQIEQKIAGIEGLQVYLGSLV